MSYINTVTIAKIGILAAGVAGLYYNHEKVTRWIDAHMEDPKETQQYFQERLRHELENSKKYTRWITTRTTPQYKSPISVVDPTKQQVIEHLNRNIYSDINYDLEQEAKKITGK